MLTVHIDGPNVSTILKDIKGLTHSGDSDTDCRTPNASGHPAFRFIPLLHCREKGHELFDFDTLFLTFFQLNRANSYLGLPKSRTIWQIASSVPK